MSYVAGKITAMGWWSKDRENQVLAHWDTTQQVTEKIVRYAFIPSALVLAAYQTEIPLWGILSPL
jgi:hypothetical protein